MAESPKPNGHFTAMQGSSPVPSLLLLRAGLCRRVQSSSILTVAEGVSVLEKPLPNVGQC